MYFIRHTNQLAQWYTESSKVPQSILDSTSVWTKTISTDLDALSTMYLMDARPKEKKCFMRQVTESYPVSFLKSNIQKCMRRNLLEACLSTTQQLLRQDPTECLRRLPVIIAEDTGLHHESYDLLVWIMAAQSKGYQVTVEDEQLILGAVTTACSLPFRYHRHDKGQETTIPDKGFSMLLRSCYGGMKGDQAFLRELAQRADQLECGREWISIPPFPVFTVDQMIPEAIDFHCSPSILSWCHEKTNLDIDHIRSAIWCHWSSPNVRVCRDTDCELLLYEEDKQRRMTQRTFKRIESMVKIYAEKKRKWMVTEKKKVLVQTRIKF